MVSKEFAETITKVFIKELKDPCLHYQRVFIYYQNDLISEELWREYCLTCLMSLQKTLDK